MAPESSEEPLDRLQTSVNESSRAVRRTFLAFMLTISYIAVTVSTTTDEQLVRGYEAVRLPILNARVSTPAFYFLAPLLVVLLHFNLLLYMTLLASKIVTLEKKISKLSNAHERSTQTALLDDFIFTQFLVRRSDRAKPADKLRASMVSTQLQASVRVTIWVLPVLLLLWLQSRFLPYHSWSITYFQRAAVSVDLLLLWIFSVSISSRATERVLTPRGKIPWRRLRVVRHAIATASVALASVVVLLTSYCVLTVSPPSGWLSWQVQRPIAGLFHRNLEVSEGTLVGEITRADAGHQPAEADQPLPSNRRLDLRDRDLRFADFTRADLKNADLRGAHLEGAKLGGARLLGARLTSGDSFGGGYEIRGANLRGAELWRVHLPDAFLNAADLEFAYAHGAQLPGADLRGANLLGAWTRLMELPGADLREAQLRAIDSLSADLRGADLRRAQLQGADLTFADLRGADLRDAQLQGANLRGVHLDGADLRRASIWNASFKEATLHLADLREIKTDDPVKEKIKWVEEAEKIENLVDRSTIFWVGKATDRLRAAMRENQIAPLGEVSNHEDSIYEPNNHAFAGWGEPPSFSEFRRKVIPYLAKLACDDAWVARGILCERPSPGDENRSKGRGIDSPIEGQAAARTLVPHTSYVTGFVDPRTSEVFHSLESAKCEILSRLPPDTVEELRAWEPGTAW